jgi:uncharacterized protein (DUF1015 family)
MPEISLIKGVLYDTARVDAGKVIAPPYDVISEDERAALEALDPHNVVRLILPRGDGDAKYAGAAELFQKWQAEGVLKRDARPAVYRYHQAFQLAELPGRNFTRRGIICAVRIHAYDEKVILPHERTLRGPKEDRLKLMRATGTHFSQIFGLYRDPSRTADDAFARTEHRAPDLEGKTADGTTHRLWRVTDREALADIGRTISPLKVYIADGHHRYETMLALRDEIRAARGGTVGYRAASEFATFFLTNMSDPGMVVLPFHRLVHSVQGFDADAFLAKLRTVFEVDLLSGGAKNIAALKTHVHELGQSRPSFGIVLPGSDHAWLASLAHDPRLPVHKALAQLDVTVLHGVVLERFLGIDREAQEKQTHITYVKDSADAVARVLRKEAQVGFIMNPTRVDQVLHVADAGETMPQKSTFFYPKIASGMVMNPISPDEDLDKAW